MQNQVKWKHIAPGQIKLGRIKFSCEVGIKFEPSSLITIESSGYARPFDRIPVEEHTCMHPRRDVVGSSSFAQHTSAQNCTSLLRGEAFGKLWLSRRHSRRLCSPPAIHVGSRSGHRRMTREYTLVLSSSCRKAQEQQFIDVVALQLSA